MAYKWPSLWEWLGKNSPSNIKIKIWESNTELKPETPWRGHIWPPVGQGRCSMRQRGSGRNCKRRRAYKNPQSRFKKPLDSNCRWKNIFSGLWLSHPSEKYESQLGWLFPVYGKTRNVPNHQPVFLSPDTSNEWRFCEGLTYERGFSWTKL